MNTVAVIFDTQVLSRTDFNKIAQGGRILGVSGLLNLRWEEFSALDAARELGLSPVAWETTRDDTPGTLTCVIRYDALPLSELRGRLLDSPVLDYEIREGWHLPSVIQRYP